MLMLTLTTYLAQNTISDEGQISVEALLIAILGSGGGMAVIGAMVNNIFGSKKRSVDTMHTAAETARLFLESALANEKAENVELSQKLDVLELKIQEIKLQHEVKLVEMERERETLRIENVSLRRRLAHLEEIVEEHGIQ